MRQVLTGLLGLALLTGCGAAQVSPVPPVAGPYVALGDSYTSGPGIAPQAGDPAGCHRSAVNYPALVAKQLGVAEFTDVSCSSATTADLTGAQKLSGGGSNQPQLDALSAGTKLVTVGIGGNDVGFLDVLSRCAMAGLTGSGCRKTFESADGTDQVSRRITTAGEKLGAVLAETGRRAPAAKVLVVGYPALFPADPAGCAKTLGRAAAAADVSYLTRKAEELNAELKRRAAAAGAKYVDTTVAGHDMCAAPDTRWIEPPFPAEGLTPVHPNAAGQRAMAAAVLAAL
ncbi:lysophospholipase L1-like esterase [Kitasatospora gansuensis]|uniref:Lysophospholipase L1-like esterase n=1 Tax=Kitasatospora gansuensis TaxID=258050 RepID=A0A7W7WJQ9_9ACTN|nr:SGNH/GDSL hydrolase family protein [Kitasatospora gansuensis]MBB4949423.1 lysophospholipase L1-like esterase [Kitasatospora gansuensis]